MSRPFVESDLWRKIPHCSEQGGSAQRCRDTLVDVEGLECFKCLKMNEYEDHFEDEYRLTNLNRIWAKGDEFDAMFDVVHLDQVDEVDLHSFNADWFAVSQTKKLHRELGPRVLDLDHRPKVVRLDLDLSGNVVLRGLDLCDAEAHLLPCCRDDSFGVKVDELVKEVAPSAVPFLSLKLQKDCGE